MVSHVRNCARAFVKLLFYIHLTEEEKKTQTSTSLITSFFDGSSILVKFSKWLVNDSYVLFLAFLLLDI